MVSPMADKPPMAGTADLADGRPPYRMVEHIPDLIQPEEYDDHPEGRLVRISISADGEGVQVIGDAFRPELLEGLLEALGPDVIEQMLCG